MSAFAPRKHRLLSRSALPTRQNKPAIKVRPVDSGADVETAKLLTGLIRNIEQQSDADTAYITAVENTATCGMGHWRITTEFSDDDSLIESYGRAATSLVEAKTGRALIERTYELKLDCWPTTAVLKHMQGR